MSREKLKLAKSMASGNRPRRSLSEKLRGMRFMQQNAEADIREKLAAQQEAREKAAHWTLEGPDGDIDTFPMVVIEEGLSDNPMLGRSGRQSFGSFNVTLENGKNGKEEKKETKMQENTEAKEEREIGVEPKPFTPNDRVHVSEPKRDGRGGPRLLLQGGISKKARNTKGFKHNRGSNNFKHAVPEGYIKKRRHQR